MTNSPPSFRHLVAVFALILTSLPLAAQQSVPQMARPRVVQVESGDQMGEALNGCDRVTVTVSIEGATIVLDFQEPEDIAKISQILWGAFHQTKSLTQSVDKSQDVLPGIDLAMHKLPNMEPPLSGPSEYVIGTCWLAESQIPKDLRLFLAQRLQFGMQHFAQGAR